jgi:hypothetical protein
MHICPKWAIRKATVQDNFCFMKRVFYYHTPPLSLVSRGRMITWLYADCISFARKVQ